MSVKTYSGVMATANLSKEAANASLCHAESMFRNVAPVEVCVMVKTDGLKVVLSLQTLPVPDIYVCICECNR